MKKILLIEDSEDIRINTAEILALSNYQVIEAENGKVGVEKALKEKPDLIICDIMMPVLDGYGVLHAIHKNDDIRNTPFIFLTAKTDRSDLRKGMELGADDFITKPFSGIELLNAVESRLRKIELLKQEYVPGLEGLNGLLQHSGKNNMLNSLIENRNTNKYKKKHTIYTEGNHPNKLFYVIKGKIKVFKSNAEGKELVTDVYIPGDFLGYVALLEGSVYNDTAQAMEDTELAIIPKEEFDEFMNCNNEVTLKFIRLLAKNISSKENLLLGVAYNSLRRKVADTLLMLHQKFEVKNKKNTVIDINRENLANMAGTAKESLIRTLSDFKSEKLIDIGKDGNITILNIKKLENLFN